MTSSDFRLYRLSPHPTTLCEAVRSLTVEVHPERAAGASGWRLRYRLQGDLQKIKLPAQVDHPKPADGLWQATCFEAFVGDSGSTAYREFNFSPSGNWASYRFSDQRIRDDAPVQDLLPAEPPDISMIVSPHELTLDAKLPHFPTMSGQCLLGLTAVIETSSGVKSYWALSHPAGLPDFHHNGGWTAHLDQSEAD